jgi:hypothetical protein
MDDIDNIKDNIENIKDNIENIRRTVNFVDDFIERCMGNNTSVNILKIFLVILLYSRINTLRLRTNLMYHIIFSNDELIRKLDRLLKDTWYSNFVRKISFYLV